jgi:hypothetical protein
LHAEVNDPEVLASRSRERGFSDRAVAEPAAQVADCRDDPQGHVHRVAGMERRPLPVWRSGAPTFGLATGTSPLAAPPLEQWKLLGLRKRPGARSWRVEDHEYCIFDDVDSVKSIAPRFRQFRSLPNMVNGSAKL